MLNLKKLMCDKQNKQNWKFSQGSLPFMGVTTPPLPPPIDKGEKNLSIKER